MIEKEELDRWKKILEENTLENGEYLFPSFEVPKSDVCIRYKKALKGWRNYIDHEYKRSAKLRKKAKALRHYRKKLIKLNKRKTS